MVLPAILIILIRKSMPLYQGCHILLFFFNMTTLSYMRKYTLGMPFTRIAGSALISELRHALEKNYRNFRFEWHVARIAFSGIVACEKKVTR